MEKTEEELENMREACKITCDRLNECLDKFETFKTEGEVKTFLSQELEMAFDPIVASGKHAAEPHYAGNTELLRGFCVVDFGVKYNGYCADITRMVYIGKPSEEEVRLYYWLLKEQQRMIKRVKEGTSLKYIEKAFRQRLGKLNTLFIHMIGHGVGKEIHEFRDKRLKTAEVVTIEPGLYVPESWGIRIEDTIIVGTREILTNSVTKELRVVQ
jgi:Xaa-Pro aminopeptidase